MSSVMLFCLLFCHPDFPIMVEPQQGEERTCSHTSVAGFRCDGYDPVPKNANISKIKSHKQLKLTGRIDSLFSNVLVKRKVS